MMSTQENWVMGTEQMLPVYVVWVTGKSLPSFLLLHGLLPGFISHPSPHTPTMHAMPSHGLSTFLR